jgi:hypothetical protein
VIGTGPGSEHQAQLLSEWGQVDFLTQGRVPLDDAIRADLARRRVRVFETMLPFRLAANIKRYQSPFLMAEYGRVITVERELVMRLLPAPVLANKVAAEALCATLSFQNWRALRHDQGLPAEEAGTVTAHMVEALLAALPQGGDR